MRGSYPAVSSYRTNYSNREQAQKKKKSKPWGPEYQKARTQTLENHKKSQETPEDNLTMRGKTQIHSEVGENRTQVQQGSKPEKTRGGKKKDLWNQIGTSGTEQEKTNQ